MLPLVPSLVGFAVEEVALVHAVPPVSPRELSEFPHDPRPNPGLLVELARKPVVQRLAWVEPAGGDLNACSGIAALLEHEQLVAARDVGDDA
jgi:hypothetical protein